MKKDLFVVIFMAVLIILIVIALIRPMLTPSGRATAFIEKLCSENVDCDEGKVCCYFSDQDAGVCDYQESCEKIRQTTSESGFPRVEQPRPANPDLFYGAIVAMLAGVFVLGIVFFKKTR